MVREPESATMDCLDQIWADLDDYNKSKELTSDTKPINTTYFCNCGGYKVFGNEGLPVCTSCGTVDSSYIDDSPEWISGVNEDGSVNDPARCGMPKDTELFSEQWGVGTVMNIKYGSYQQKRLARINFHNSMNHKDRALFHAYKDIDSAAKDILCLSEVVLRQAKIMYRKFNGEKLTRGAVRTGIKANCVMYACKLNNVPRTTKEIADAFGIPTKDISRTSDIFKDMIIGKSDNKITKPSDVLHRMLNEFDLPDRRKTRVACLKYADSLEECVPLMGKTPNSIAAVVILKVLGLTKSEVVARCGVSAPTLNKIEVIVNKYLEDKSEK